jgi:hypothetical protein
MRVEYRVSEDVSSLHGYLQAFRERGIAVVPLENNELLIITHGARDGSIARIADIRTIISTANSLGQWATWIVVCYPRACIARYPDLASRILEGDEDAPDGSMFTRWPNDGTITVHDKAGKEG